MPASLRALLAQAIDYPGIFPPCSLDVAAAKKKQADYVHSADAWMLSTFVLPLAQFNAATTSIAIFDRKYPLRLSVLGPKQENAYAFRCDRKEMVEVTDCCPTEDPGNIVIAQWEMLLPADTDLKI